MAKRVSGIICLCGHTISYFYGNVPNNASQEFMQFLEEHTEERVRECIAEDYVEGTLCFGWQFNNGKYKEFNGYWSIDRG